MDAPGAVAAPRWLQLFCGHPRRDSGMERSRGPQSDDHALTIRALASDTDAFFALADRHQARMYSTVLRIVGDPHEAEDVVQDALLRGHAKLHTFRAEAGLATWL